MSETDNQKDKSLYPPYPSTPEEKLERVSQSEAPPKKEPFANWDRSFSLRPVIIIVAVVALVVILMLMLSMCGRVATPTVTGEGDNPYGIVQQRVDEAFDNGPNGQDRSRQTQGSNAQEQPQQQQGQQQQAQTPEERELQRLQQQQQILEQREEIRQQQREAIPSPLPEDAPEPAPLGKY